MKFIAFALIALVAISSVRADTITVMACLGQIADPCGTDGLCTGYLNQYTSCLSQNACTSRNPSSQVVTCMNNCTPNNALVQGYVKEQISCVNATVLSFAGLLLTIFAFAF